MDLLSRKISKDDYMIDSKLDVNNSSLIYGEVLFESLINIIKDFEISNNVNLQNRYFIDIGSGCGKIVSSLALKLNLNIDGIEIDENRYNKSVELINKLELNNQVYLYNLDFRKIYFGNYDVIFCCNLVFNKDDNNDLYDKIINEFRGYAFLLNFNYKIKKYMIKITKVKTSWNDGQDMFIFHFN